MSRPHSAFIAVLAAILALPLGVSVHAACVGPGDLDADGVLDDCDNCTRFANADQADADTDYLGDVCDFAWGDVAPAGAWNGTVDVGDVVRLLRFAVQLEAATAEELRRGDIAPASIEPGTPTEATPILESPSAIAIGDVVLGLRVSVGLTVMAVTQVPHPPPVDEEPGAWPVPNEWSWDGSWTPEPGAFPLPGLFDDEYFDGHLDRGGRPTPVLPPGEWDWDDSNDDLANWNGFQVIGRFDRRVDTQGRHFGWRLVGNNPEGIDFSAGAAYFGGSAGADVLDLGPQGEIDGWSTGTLGGGPDVLVFNKAWSLDYRTGSSASGGGDDNDLVVGGCDVNVTDSLDIFAMSVHAGPGSDWVFVRDIGRAGVDLGNGENGRTDAVDPGDGDDLVELRGNTIDFRVFGGRGNDTAVWYVDENVQTTGWLGPNFFGGGAWGDALWSDPGTDRLVLAVPPDTPVTPNGPAPGTVRVRASSGVFQDDPPTRNDPFARYCIECGVGPGGRKTFIVHYVRADNRVNTGYAYLTAFEELQVGVGEGAKVYRIDDVNGTATLAPDLEPFVPPAFPEEYCAPGQ